MKGNVSSTVDGVERNALSASNATFACFNVLPTRNV